MTIAIRLAEKLAQAVRSPASRELAIADWRLLVDTGTSTEVGLKDNQPGGPYEAPNAVTGTRGEAYIRWADGKVSDGTVDRTTLDHFGEDLALWREAAFEDEFAPEVLGPQAIAPIPLFDPAVAEMVFSRHEPLFTLLERYRKELPPFDADRVSGSATVSTNRRHLITSQGLDHQSETTSFGTYADVDHRAYEYLSLRRFAEAEEVTAMIERLGRTNRLLRQEATLSPGRQPIILMPSVTDAFLNKYLLTNLDGQRVLNGSSAFSLEQFASQARLFHPDFTLVVDPTRPLSPGAYQLTREGVPTRRFTLIDEGRLQTPLLDLKHAKKCGRAPTPYPRGGSSFEWGTGPKPSLEALVAGLDRALVVHQMLGLHTQDSTRGNFSLTVTQGLVVEHGAIKGHAKALLVGNFLTAMQEGFRLATVSGRETPALLIEADVVAG